MSGVAGGEELLLLQLSVSHGGLPSMAEKPPVQPSGVLAGPLSGTRKISGNSRCQWKSRCRDGDLVDGCDRRSAGGAIGELLRGCVVIGSVIRGLGAEEGGAPGVGDAARPDRVVGWPAGSA